MKIYTIGHSSHNIEKFVELLRANNINLLVDVRSAPYSRYNPQFNKESLQQILFTQDIHYANAGKYLGGRPLDASCYRGGKIPAEGVDYLHEVNYPEVMKKKWFIQGIERLIELADQDLTAIMCSEEDPALCHRHHLIAKYLSEVYPEVEVIHIRGDGNKYNARSILTSVNQESADQLSLF